MMLCEFSIPLSESERPHSMAVANSCDGRFAKTNRGWNEYDRKVIDQVTEYAELSGYSSYEMC
jgi:hypothetical protein